MAEPFLGEIRIFGFGTIPTGWIPCNGQLLPIQGNQALFAILTTTYGGDGRTNFAVPDLRGRVPIHPSANPNIPLGQSAGEAAHTLTTNEIPPHNHTLQANSATASSKAALNNVLAGTGTINSYALTTPNAKMAIGTIGAEGQSMAHNNMQPYLTLSFCIATTGVFPPRT